jgi:hypothetical protein
LLFWDCWFFFGIVAIVMSFKNKDNTDYYALFVMGVTWLVFGLLFQMSVFFMLGFIFTLVGLVHKDKWKKKKLSSR